MKRARAARDVALARPATALLAAALAGLVLGPAGALALAPALLARRPRRRDAAAGGAAALRARGRGRVRPRPDGGARSQRAGAAHRPRGCAQRCRCSTRRARRRSAGGRPRRSAASASCSKARDARRDGVRVRSSLWRGRCARRDRATAGCAPRACTPCSRARQVRATGQTPRGSRRSARRRAEPGTAGAHGPACRSRRARCCAAWSWATTRRSASTSGAACGASGLGHLVAASGANVALLARPGARGLRAARSRDCAPG